MAKEGIDMPEIEKEVLDETPTGKTFTEDYVKTIREEAKENRLARKAAEKELAETKSKFKAFLGLKDEDELKDEHISAYKANQESALTAALQKANERLLQAEIKSLDGYDTKLVTRLLDKSKVKIADDGSVTGLKEAVEALEIEFPLIKKANTQGGANPPPNNVTEIESLQAEYNDAVKKGDTVTAVTLKNKLFFMRK
jgi:hypothetical protein